MYNFIIVLVLSLVCSASFAGSCDNGTCRAPVKNAAKAVVNFSERVVTAPFKVARNTRSRIQSNRAYRQRSRCTNCN
jgi:cell shape-determining protein MreC